MRWRFAGGRAGQLSQDEMRGLSLWGTDVLDILARLIGEATPGADDLEAGAPGEAIDAARVHFEHLNGLITRRERPSEFDVARLAALALVDLRRAVAAVRAYSASAEVSKSAERSEAAVITHSLLARLDEHLTQRLPPDAEELVAATRDLPAPARAMRASRWSHGDTVFRSRGSALEPAFAMEAAGVDDDAVEGAGASARDSGSYWAAMVATGARTGASSPAAAVETEQPAPTPGAPTAPPGRRRPAPDPNDPHYPRSLLFKVGRWALRLWWLVFLYYVGTAGQNLFTLATQGGVNALLNGPNLVQALLLNQLAQLWTRSPALVAGGVVLVLALVLLGRMAHADQEHEREVLRLRDEDARQAGHAATVMAGARATAQATAHATAHAAAQAAVPELVDRHLAGRGLPEGAPAEPQGPPFDEGLLPPPERFVGREPDLVWALARLRAGGATGITALRGLGGIGKTALAAVAVRRLRAEGRFPDGIAVVLCQGLTDATDVLRRVLMRFDPQRRQPEATDLAGLAEAAHRLLDGRDALVVLDNVEPELAVADVVAPLRAAGATLLLTARQILPRAAVPVEANRTLDLLSPAEALDLFAEALGRGGAADLPTAERGAAERIVASLDRHTLAVKLAGAYAAGVQRDLEALARELADPAHAIALPEDEAPDAVARVFASSYAALPPDARRLFAALGAFATPEFGRRAALALATGLDLAAPEASVNLLVRRALVDALAEASLPAESDRERLRLHPLLRAFAAAELARGPDAQHATAHLSVARHYAAYANATRDAALGPDEANITGALEWAHAQGQDELVARICDGMRGYWRDRSRTQAALRYLPWGIQAAEVIAGRTGTRQDTLRHANLSVYYGDILYNTGKLVDAEKRYQADLSIRRAVQDRRGEGAVLTSLGQVAQARGQLDAAAGYYEQALAIDREVQDRRGEGVVLTSLGQVAQARGQLDAAAGYYEQALAIDREVQDRRGEGVVLTSLGQVAQARGQLDAAAGYYEQALAILRAVQDRRGEGVVLTSQGQVAQARGQLDAAAGYYEQALAIDREVQARRGEGVVLTSLGQVAQARGQLDAAVGYYEQALAIDREVQDRQGEGVVLTSLGQVAQARGQLDAAAGYYEQALAIDREVQDRQGEGVVLTSLGHVAQARGQLDAAVGYYEQALAIRRAVQDRRGEGVVLAQLGLIAQARGRWDEAEEYFRRCLALMREVQDAANEATIALILGQFLIERRGNRDEGCPLVRRAAAIRQELGLPGLDEARATARRLGCLADEATPPGDG